jgi:hypothetical protein
LKNNVLNKFKTLFFSILIVNFNKIILDIDINNKDFKLIKIYYYVCEKFEESLKFECERFSNNNNNPDLTDQELITIYLFLMNHQGMECLPLV